MTMLKVIRNIYVLICLFVTIGLSLYSIFRYIKNEDTTLVQITKFLSSSDAIYPSLSLCILPPFLEKSFAVYHNDGINMSSYTRFLSGETWDKQMLRVDYDDVSVSLTDTIINASYFTYSSHNYIWDPIHYVSFRSSERKCFTINSPIPNTDLLWYFEVTIKNEIFPNGVRSTENSLYVYLHYPGQRLAGLHTIKNDFYSRKNQTTSYDMSFQVKDIDVTARRNTVRNPCIEDWRNHDGFILDQMMNEIGCRPPHWTTRLNLSICSDTTQMKKFARQPNYGIIETFHSPCRMIDRLDYLYQEDDIVSERY